MTVRELPEEEGKALLSRTGLDIQIAGDSLKGKIKFYAAHGKERSIAVLIYDTLTTVWEITGANKQERHDAVESVRERYAVK